MRPKFGQLCRVSAYAYKYTEGDPKDRSKFWTRLGKQSMNPRDGLYIGYRIVHEGSTEDIKEYGEYGEVLSKHRVFIHESSREVWLIVFNERENPIRVFPEDVSSINEEGTK